MSEQLKKWEYCPECGSLEIHHSEIQANGYKHLQCAICHQEYFEDIDYSRVVRENLEDKSKQLSTLSPQYTSKCDELDSVRGEKQRLAGELDQAITERNTACDHADRLLREASIHAQEARTANATITEIYQVLTGATGEPGNWNGAEPARKIMAELATVRGERAQWESRARKIDQTCQRLIAEPDQMREAVVPEWLFEIAHKLRTQDNRITSEPLFCVFQKRRIWGMDEAYGEHSAWVQHDEGCEVDESEVELDEFGDPVNDIFEKLYYIDVDEFVSAHLTDDAAKLFLEKNKHRLKKPFTYVTSQYRCPEYIQLRDWLMSLTPTQPQPENSL